ncbi:hypothetical protein [Methylocystis rosea]|uniref:hypothetical protein n=1 Tax=Methylocystis rosea TaxID=173366 RepID=UPI000376E468|nr:hypothetical protein [Methylocystis rosea]
MLADRKRSGIGAPIARQKNCRTEARPVIAPQQSNIAHLRRPGHANKFNSLSDMKCRTNAAYGKYAENTLRDWSRQMPSQARELLVGSHLGLRIRFRIEEAIERENIEGHILTFNGFASLLEL